MNINNIKRKIIQISVIVVLLILIYAIAPVLHPFVMFFYTNPIVPEVFTIFTLILIPLVYKGSLKELGGMFVVVMIILSLILSPLIYYANACSLTTLQKENIPKNIKNLQEFDFSKGGYLRILPKKVAETYMISSLEYPRYTIGDVHITTFNNSMFWFSYLEPDGLFNRIILKSRGVFLIPANTTERIIIRKEKRIEYTPGQLITDNLYWRLYRFDYFANYGKPRVVVDNNHIYTIVPQIKYKFHLFYTTPYWSGIVVIDENGNMKFYSREEALKIYNESVIFPESLARKIIESQNYWKKSAILNIINLWITHENEIELVDVGENRQPYLIMVNGKPYWIFAVEPYGRAYGISKIFIINMSGDIEAYKFKEPKIGPIKGMDYVQKALPTYDWERFEIVEPLPVFVNNTLYWRYIIIPKSGGGVSKIVLVNVNTGNVKVFNSVENYAKFIKCGEINNKHHNNITIKEIIKYEKDGNTYWIIILSNKSYIQLSAKNMTIKDIIKISNLKVGETYNWSFN